jgi:hypothetical protein
MSYTKDKPELKFESGEVRLVIPTKKGRKWIRIMERTYQVDEKPTE